MLLSNICQTPKAQMFSECKIPRTWTANIHLLMIPHMYLSPSALGNTTIPNQPREMCFSTVYFCNLNNKVFGHNNYDLLLRVCILVGKANHRLVTAHFNVK